MEPFLFKIDNQNVQYFFDASFFSLSRIIPKEQSVILTDEHIYGFHPEKFSAYKRVIVIPSGASLKTQATIDRIIQRMIDMQVDRSFYLIGVGGGVVTDMAGYAASVFKRGIKLVLVPTTLLNLVDASLGGKNGIDVGVYKNMVGTIYQPEIICQDLDFLTTLPEPEWSYGFAEIVKHACIGDRKLFDALSKADLDFYRDHKDALQDLIETNIMIKMKVVQKDVRESGERKLLNFGHTFGHAVENLYQLPHGQAVAIGMVVAAYLSQAITGFDGVHSLISVLKRYGLPVQYKFDTDEVIGIMGSDKKRKGRTIDFVLLEKIGKAKIVPLELSQISRILNQIRKQWK
ncbi:MAG: 3-dehydroquinate synthase [Taibaiella sp.]|nr:3-dehydroquinate synthase [Taibaiella sp.]